MRYCSTVGLFTLHHPGHHLAGLPPEQLARVTTLLRTCQNHLTDAAVGLELHARAASQAHALRDSPQELGAKARRLAVERQMSRDVPAWRRMLDAASQVITERAARGEMPADYAFRLPSIRADVAELPGVGAVAAWTSATLDADL